METAVHTDSPTQNTATAQALVADYMTAGPVTVEVTEPLYKIYENLGNGKYRHLPVVDAQGNCVGILSDRDLRNVMMALDIVIPAVNGEESKLEIEDVMSKNPLTVSPDTTLKHAAGMMMQHVVGALPVTAADGKLAGIVTYTDVLRAYCEVS